MQALQDLSTTLMTLVKAQAMQFLRGEIIKHTVLAALWRALSPTMWTKVTKLIGKHAHAHHNNSATHEPALQTTPG